jgi:hypothetical protein
MPLSYPKAVNWTGPSPDDPPPCDSWASEIVANPEHWTPFDYDVDHCLSERVEERCAFNGNTTILIIVIVFNIIKVAGMLWTAFGLGTNIPFITVGDAIASFLRNPDPTTKGYSLWSRNDFKHNTNTNPTELARRRQHPNAWLAIGPKAAPLQEIDIRKSKVAVRKPLRLMRGASRQRWVWTLLLISFALLIVLGLFIAGLTQIRAHDTPVSALGFGKIHASALVNGWGVVQINNTNKQIATAVIIANLPQMALSFLYLNLNGLVTSIALTQEYLRFFHRRAPLRVSLPRPGTNQRSAWFLQLPYHLGVPLLILVSISSLRKINPWHP